MTPRVTVTMPAYNAEATIREAVDSVLAQTMRDFELVIVDDGSRIPVREVLADVLDDERIRIVEHETNQGLGRTRNTALREARAPILAHLDSDDLWEPEYLEAVLPCLDDPAVGLAYCNVHVFGMHEEIYVKDPSIHPVDHFPALGKRNEVPGFVCVRKAAVEQVGGYAEFTWGAMDWYLYLRLVAAGWRFAYVDRVLAHYRWTSASMSQDYDKVLRSNLHVLTRFIARHPFKRGTHSHWLRLAIYLGAKRIPGARRLKRMVTA